MLAKRPPKMYTKEEIQKMKKCPECDGHGKFKTPSAMWFDDVTCAKCYGRGWIWNE